MLDDSPAAVTFGPYGVHTIGGLLQAHGEASTREEAHIVTEPTTADRDRGSAMRVRRADRAPREPAIRVLVADDHPNIRQALVEIVNREPSLALVGAAASGDEAVTLSRQQSPDVVVMDVHMPRMGGVEATRRLRAGSPAPKVLAYSAYADTGAVMEMLRAGAAGYLLKGASAREILGAIHGAMRGESPLSGAVSTEVVDRLRDDLRREAETAWSRSARIQALSGALSGECMSIVYQPIVSLANGGGPIGFEALARFSMEPRMTPDAWFREAWELGLGPVLELAAVRAAVAHVAEVPAGCYLSVNVGPDVVGSPELAEILEGLPLPSLIIEITEQAPINDYEAVGRTLAPWRAGGLRVAIDDAGAGFASLRHIVRMRPDVIKLDISLVRNIDCDTVAGAMARSLSSFGREMEATIVGEGVETPAELATLSTLGISGAQGFLVGRPMRRERAFGPSGRWERGA
jgi:EAL domain-containing protein (putative c-di-GMP-specific phosphodiesterase class I)/CheY-like chemotaxis protein